MFGRLSVSRSSSFRTLIAFVAVILAVSALFGGRLVSAQDEDAPHLAHIHPGTCDDLNPEPEYPLNDVSADFNDDDGSLVGESLGSADVSQPVEGSVTVVDGLALADITGDEAYAINLHESAEAADVYIACGNVSGPLIDGNLVVGLAEQNDSDYSGVAVLTEVDGGLEVTLYVTKWIDPEADGADDAADDADDATAEADDATEEADGADDAAAADGASVSIIDFDFDAPELTVAVGTTVTWTNDGGAPHTVTADDGSFDSGNMASGDTFSFTFEEAGEFSYICKIHPSMQGTIIVE